MLLVVDLAAAVFLGVEGAMAAIEGNLDIFGILVLSFATALGGGVIRDLLIGAIPPAATEDPRYAIAAFAGGAATFFSFRLVQEVPNGLLVGFDAVGLALFAVAGAAKALDRKIAPFMAVLMGTLTGVGGGTIRDIFLARVPAILRVDVYAVAALAGAAVMVVGMRLGLPRKWMMPAGAVVCFVLREYAVWRHLNLPKASG
jgi:uncharacterized membrane protein YeiH